MGKLAISPRLPFLPLRHVVITRRRWVLEEKSTHLNNILFVVKISGRSSFQHATLYTIRLWLELRFYPVNSCIFHVCYACCVKHGCACCRNFCTEICKFSEKGVALMFTWPQRSPEHHNKFHLSSRPISEGSAVFWVSHNTLLLPLQLRPGHAIFSFKLRAACKAGFFPIHRPWASASSSQGQSTGRGKQTRAWRNLNGLEKWPQVST